MTAVEGATPVVAFRPETAVAFVADIFEAWGASVEAAATVARHLIESEQMGLPSHGLIRVSQYVSEIERGLLKPAAELTVTQSWPAVAVVDGNWTFGQVAAAAAVELVTRFAEETGIGFVAVRRVQHTGRIGAYTQPLADRGFLAIATGSGAPRFHRMAPAGGREGRTSTNPISWAVPTESTPVVADMATSSIPEGRVRVMHTMGQPLPPDAIIDGAGRESLDASDFYGDPPQTPPGSMLPLGGSRYGHKGYALALLAESLATLMAGDEVDAEDRGNNLGLIAIRGDATLSRRASQMAVYMKSAEPIDPTRPVLMPGEVEQASFERATHRLEIPESVWRDVVRVAEARGVPVPAVH